MPISKIFLEKMSRARARTMRGDHTHTDFKRKPETPWFSPELVDRRYGVFEGRMSEQRHTKGDHLLIERGKIWVRGVEILTIRKPFDRYRSRFNHAFKLVDGVSTHGVDAANREEFVGFGGNVTLIDGDTGSYL